MRASVVQLDDSARRPAFSRNEHTSSLVLAVASVRPPPQPEKPEQSAAQKDDGGGLGNRRGVCELVVGPFNAPGGRVSVDGRSPG